MDIYFETINVVEEAVTDDTKFPVVKDNKLKRCCWVTLESIKLFFNYVKFNIDASEKKKEH